MKRRILSIALALCLCISSQSAVYAAQGTSSMPGDATTKETTYDSDTGGDAGNEVQKSPSLSGNVPVMGELTEGTADRPAARSNAILSPTEVYKAMIALKDQDGYKEGTPWTNDEPYSDAKGNYHWKGGPLNGVNISAVGCVAFAFVLSDAAFGSYPARMYAAGEFSFEDIKTGDILRLNNDAHTVIVLEVSDVGVVVAEGNISIGDNKGKVHWGRGISKEDVMRDASHYITRYPEGYIPPDNPEADISIGSGTLEGGLTWNLTKAGTLTVSGKGAMPDFSGTAEQPWLNKASQIRKVIIEEGVTSIGSCAFWNCGVISAEISSSVAMIGNSAFRSSQMISVTVPSSVKIIGDSAFQGCQNLSSVTIQEGVETINQNAFRACTNLASIALPASIGEVGAAAFFECTSMGSAVFAPGSKQVKLGDNIFTRCYYLMSVTLPRNIDRIGVGMFQNCAMLAGVEIPEGAESIEQEAFASCAGLTTVIIPDSVMAIGIGAFAACSLADIYFTGTEEQWKNIRLIGDTASALSNVRKHYNYVSDIPPAPGPDDGDDSNNDTGGNPGDNTGEIPGGDNTGNNPGSDGSGDGNNQTESESGKDNSTALSSVNLGINAAMEAWKPRTADEIKRYACVGKEPVRYTQPKDNNYPVIIKNAIQGPMCFKSFEAVLGDYTIGRTYNIYARSNAVYSMDKEIQLTLEIPPAIYNREREYKMICVTEGGQPIIYNDLDSSPETITIRTNKFYAYALIYR